MSILQKIRNSLVFEYHYLKDSTYSRVTFPVLALIFFYLFSQNFVFSENFEMLKFREIDDVAFHTTLRNAHLNILNLKFSKLFQLNDYGYGWLYWFPVVILTFPLYLLSDFIGSMPLIVFPRMHSLFFMMASVLVILRLLNFFKSTKGLNTVILILFVSASTFGHFSMRFGTIAQTLFFSILALFSTLRINKLDSKSLFSAALPLAAAGATKLSGLLVSPVIGLILIDKALSNYPIKKSVKKGGLYLMILLTSLLTLANPALILSLFRIKYLKNYAGIMKWAMSRVSEDSTGNFSALNNFTQGFSGNYYHLYILSTIIFISFFIVIFDCVNEKNEKLLSRYKSYILIGFTVSLLYIIFKVKMGPLYAANYYSNISYLPLLALIPISHNIKKSIVCFLLFLIITNLFINNEGMFTKSSYGFNYNTYFHKKNSQQDKIQEHLKLNALIKAKSSSAKVYRILIDYRSPLSFSSFDKRFPQSVFFDNFSNLIATQQSYDFIIISKEYLNFLENKNLNYKEKENKLVVYKLLNTNRINHRLYEKIADEKYSIVFFSDTKKMQKY